MDYPYRSKTPRVRRLSPAIVPLLFVFFLQTARPQALAATPIKVGADAYLRKPFRKEEILEVLARTLGTGFIFEDEAEARGSGPPATPREAAAPVGLSGELILEMRNAVAEGDLARFTSLVAEARKGDPAYTDRLERPAARYDYPPLEEIPSKGGD